MTVEAKPDSPQIYYGVGIPNYFYAAFACLVPAALLFIWFLSDNSLPQSDGANYLGSALKVWKVFVDEGIGSGIVSLFWDRGWRPISFPVFIVPFLLATGGNVVLTVTLAGMTLVGLIGLYSYRILRLGTDPLPAMFAAALVGSMPLVQFHGAQVLSEAGFLVTALAAIYHLVRSDWLTRTGHFWLAIVFLALCATIRPAETLLVLAPPVGAVVAWGMLSGRFTWSSIFTSAALLGAGFSIWLVSIFVSPEVGITIPGVEPFGLVALASGIKLFVYFMAAIAVVGILWLISVDRAGELRPSRRLVTGSLLFSGLMVAWWGPFAHGLYRWFHANTIGGTIRASPAPLYDTVWQQVVDYAVQSGVIVLVGALVLALVGGVLRRSGGEHEWRAGRSIAVLLLAMVPLTLVGVVLGPQTDVRRMMVPIVGATIALLLVGLAPGGFRHLRTGAVFLILVAQGALVVAAARDLTPHNSLRPVLSGKIHIPYFKPEPNTAIIEFINGLNANGEISRIAPMIFTAPADAFTVSELVPYLGNGYGSAVVQLPVFHGDEDIRWFRDRSDISHVVLGVPGGTLVSDDIAGLRERLRARRDTETNPYYRFDAHLALRVLDGTIDQLGLVPIDTLTLGGQEFILLKVDR